MGFRGEGGACSEVEVDGEGKQTVGHSWATGCRTMVVRPVAGLWNAVGRSVGVSQKSRRGGSIFIHMDFLRADVLKTIGYAKEMTWETAQSVWRGVCCDNVGGCCC